MAESGPSPSPTPDISNPSPTPDLFPDPCDIPASKSAPVAEPDDDAWEGVLQGVQSASVGASTASSFYIDPVTGSMSNPGTSPDRAWKTLAEVLSSKTFSPGDTLYVARGYHGAPLFTSAASGVKVTALPSHTPLFHSIRFGGGCMGVTVTGPIQVSRSFAGPSSPDTAIKAAGIMIDNTCAGIVVRVASLYTVQNTSSWTGTTWRNNKVLLYTNAPRCEFQHVHLYNGGNYQPDFGARFSVADRITVENFASDGVDLKGAAPTMTRCAVYGSRKVDGNHNDLVQVFTTSYGVFVGNFLAAYIDPNQQFLDLPGLASDAQGFGGYDGRKIGWVIGYNIVKVDHPIGVWFLGPDKCAVFGNTVTRCGPTVYFSRRKDDPPRSWALPTLQMGPSKSGAIYGGNWVFNNIAESYYVPDGVAVYNAANAVVTAAQLPKVFVKPLAPAHDVHLTPVGATAFAGGVNPATVSGIPDAAKPYLTLDFDGKPVAGSIEKGALQYNAEWAPVPSAPRPVLAVVNVPGLGYDVSWASGPGDYCFEVLAGGKRVGLVRTGATSWFDVTTASSAPTYTVRTLPRVSL